ncbi:hypothetical protein AGMMS49950_02310 [Endomicrobiia bacterium]|nr:hypothetical protein AGMMS49531_03430 [Endomicrobiia bacterium]GHT69482.1 hypothetical protein AGMMS49950_02310 [Endomicrobiia bacterium]
MELEGVIGEIKKLSNNVAILDKKHREALLDYDETKLGSDDCRSVWKMGCCE